MSGATQLPTGSLFALGPTLAGLIRDYPGIDTALMNAAATWNATDAVGRIAGGSGVVSTTDCPSNTSWGSYLIGAYRFSEAFCMSNPVIGATSLVAYTHPESHSIAFNYDRAWSVTGTPLSGQFDFQHVATHEFGHLLGVGHQTNGVCGEIGDKTCADNGSIETMNWMTNTGETCYRTLEANDKQSVNWFY